MPLRVLLLGVGADIGNAGIMADHDYGPHHSYFLKYLSVPSHKTFWFCLEFAIHTIGKLFSFLCLCMA